MDGAYKQKEMPRGAHLRLRNAAIKQVLANDACNAIFTGAYNYTARPRRARLTAAEKAANAAARKARTAAARAAPEAVAARRAKARAAAARRRERKTAAVASAVSDFLGSTVSGAVAGMPRKPTRTLTAAQKAARNERDRLRRAAKRQVAAVVAGAGMIGGRRRGAGTMGGAMMGGRYMSLY